MERLPSGVSLLCNSAEQQGTQLINNNVGETWIEAEWDKKSRRLKKEDKTWSLKTSSRSDGNWFLSLGMFVILYEDHASPCAMAYVCLEPEPYSDIVISSAKGRSLTGPHATMNLTI